MTINDSQVGYYILCGQIKGFNSALNAIICQSGSYRMGGN